MGWGEGGRGKREEGGIYYMQNCMVGIISRG